MTSIEIDPALRDEALDRVFGALSDPTRRAIIQRLSEGPARIGDLAAPFDMSLAAVGKHVRVLESSGLLQRRIEGRAHICSLDPAALAASHDWLSYYREYWTQSLESLAHYVESKNDCN